MERTEKDLRNAVIEALENKSFLVVWLANELMRTRFKSRGLRKGLPDLLVLGENGFVCFVELKTPKGRLSEAQKSVIAELERRGFKVFVFRSVSDVETLNERMNYE